LLLRAIELDLIGQELIEIDSTNIVGRVPQPQQAVGKPLDLSHGPAQIGQATGDFRSNILPEEHGEQFRITRDNGEEIVQVVSDLSGHVGPVLHILSLPFAGTLSLQVRVFQDPEPSSIPVTGLRDGQRRDSQAASVLSPVDPAYGDCARPGRGTVRRDQVFRSRQSVHLPQSAPPFDADLVAEQ